MGKDILLFVVLVKHRACSCSIIVYIRCLLSLNLTKYKLLYCFGKSTSITSIPLYSAGCYFAAVDYDGGNKEHRQDIAHVGRYIEQEGADDFVVQNHGSGSVSEDCRTDCN